MNLLHKIKQIKTDAAYYSAEKVFSVVGLATVLADFSTMRMWMMLPASLLIIGAWYGVYRVIQ